MAQHTDTRTRWERSDNRLHREEEIPAAEAKQGLTGRRVLTVLIAALVLAFIVWIPVEIWGSHKADEAASPPAQSQTAPAPATSAPATPAEVDAQHR